MFLMMYSAYKLNKQGANIQPWRTPFPIWNWCVVPCPVLTVASWPAYRFLKRQVRWSGIPISFRIFHSLLWSTQWVTGGLKFMEKNLLIAFNFLSESFPEKLNVGKLITMTLMFQNISSDFSSGWTVKVYKFRKFGWTKLNCFSCKWIFNCY